MSKLADSFADRLNASSPPPLDPNYNFFVYGTTGTGKTSLVKTLKDDVVEHEAKVLMLNNDLGDKSILSAIHDEDPYRWLFAEEVEHYQDVKSAYAYLSENDHPFRWVVLDDTTRMAEMLLDKLKQPDEFGDDAWGAYGALNKRFRKLLRHFRALDTNILFLAREDKEKDPATAAFPGKALGDGNDGSSVLHEFDHAYRAVREYVEDDDDVFRLQTVATPGVEAKRRDEFGVLDELEVPNISKIRQKLVDSVRDNINQ